MKKSYLLFVITISSYNLFSQDQCMHVLIPDKLNIKYDRDHATLIINILNQENLQTYDDYKNSKFNATLPIDGVLVGLGFEQNQKGFKQFLNSLYTYGYNRVHDKQRLDAAIEKLSEASITAWRDCMNRNGFHIWVEQEIDPGTFVLAAKYNNDGANAKPRLTNVSFSEQVTTSADGSFTDRNTLTNTTYEYSGNIQRQIYKRMNDRPLTITVSATVGPGYRKTLTSYSTNTYQYKPTHTITGGSIGEWNKTISFLNDKNKNVIAQITVYFKLARFSPDATHSQVNDVSLYSINDNEPTLLQKTGPINWTSPSNTVELTYYIPIKAMTTQNFQASVGLWDRYDPANSSINWQIKY